MLGKRFGLAIAVTLAAASASPSKPEVLSPAARSKPTAATDVRVHEFGNLPLYFVENQGQADERVAYYVQGRDTTAYFTSEGVTIALTGASATPGSDTDPPRGVVRPANLRSVAETQGPLRRWTVKLDFIGASPGARPRGQAATPAVVSYFKGPRDQWKTGIRTYASLVYSELWPGIDLVFSGANSRLKYTFLIHPGADPQQIKLAYRGATSVALTSRGELKVSTPIGRLLDEKPYAYQELDGQRAEIAASYALAPVGPAGAQNYGFDLGPYDRSRPLVLDPAMLVYAGYIGGSSTDQARGIAVDGSGNAYIVGTVASTEATFPETVGPDLTFNGNVDAFVAKVNSAGTALDYAGYIGGSGSEQGHGIAVDGFGSAYVTGFTASTQASFPVQVGPDVTHNGFNDAFVAKVNPAGTALTYAGYIGGSSGDEGYAIAVDGFGNAYVTGFTICTLPVTFPLTVGPDLTCRGHHDGFVAKVNAGGTGVVYAGYVGGFGSEWGNGIAVDSFGNAYVTGRTNSTDFPAIVGPDPIYNGGTDDAFVAKVNAGGTGFFYSGYIGGSLEDQGEGIAVDGLGNAYVTGSTLSSQSDGFPVNVGPDLTFNSTFPGSGGRHDAFVAKINPGGTALDYAGYIGGFQDDLGRGIAVDGFGNAYVTGWTGSSEATFPATVGPDLTFNFGVIDAFVAKVNVAGTALLYAGYIGGSGLDTGEGIAVDGSGNAYVTGQAQSDQTTFPETVGPDLTFNGGSDAFVAKISDVSPPATLTLAPATDTNPVNTQHCVTATVEDTFGNPVANVTVRFMVAGVVNTSGSTTTNASGEAPFCYMGPTTPGVDAITAYADTDNSNTQDVGEPGGGAAKTWVPGTPATLVLAPPAATNTVGSQHCVMATVHDAFGNPTPSVIVRFTVAGSINTTSSATTNANGEATFCYTGPALPGSDAITAFADTNNNGVQDPGEPSGAATKAWVAPVTTPGCEISITDNGRITAANGDTATFHGRAVASATGETSGNQRYEDRGQAQPLVVESINVLAIVCMGTTQADMYGQATIDGSGSFSYRISVKDLGEPGRDMDTYSILLTGYSSGEQTLEAGNVQIRRTQ